jgi:diguanylate cyclase (GGDEF)-like protein
VGSLSGKAKAILIDTKVGFLFTLRDPQYGGKMALFSSPISKMELLGWKRSSWLHWRDFETQGREVHRDNQILQYWSSRDALTGTPNRQQLELVLEHQWRIAIIGPSALSLLMIEIDHFAEYVQVLGQQAGDNCLTQVACSLSNTLNQPGALVGRYDQVRFMAILPRTDLDAAVGIAKLLPGTIEGWKIPHPDSSVGAYVTISVGVAGATPQLRSKSQPLILEAEQALSQAQAHDGNRVATFRPPGLSPPSTRLL